MIEVKSMVSPEGSLLMTVGYKGHICPIEIVKRPKSEKDKDRLILEGIRDCIDGLIESVKWKKKK